MQHSTETRRERSEEDNAQVAGADEVPIRRALLEILPVDVETQNRADRDHLRRERGCDRHEGHEQDGRGAAFAGDGDGCVGEDKTAADFGAGHSLLSC